MADYPHIQARWYTSLSPGTRTVELIVLHSMEAPEKGNTAEATALYFARLPSTKKSSAHLCVDNNSVVRCVLDKDVAYAAPGANSNGLHIEMAGYAKQNRTEWLDDYSKAVILNAAAAAARWSAQYSIPLNFVDAQTLRSNKHARGVTTHWEVTKAFHKSDHTDPGPSFPIDIFLDCARLFTASPVKVAPMFNPPLQVPPVVAELKDPQTGGTWLLSLDGSVRGFCGARYLGAANGKSYFEGRQAAQLLPRDDGKDGYMIVSTNSDKYRYPE